MSSIQLQEQETLPDGIHRILGELNSLAVESLAAPSEARADGIHEARRCCKKIRAVLRLIRGPLGKKSHKRKNTFYRDIGRQLAPMRDAEVVIETFDRLVEQHQTRLRKKFARTRGLLVARARRDIPAGNLDELLEETRALLGDQRDTLLAVELVDGFAAIEAGLRRVYRNGREAMQRSLAHATTANLHEWRKEAKYLRYQVEVLRPIWPGMMKRLEKELHDLSDALGADHDLAVLQELLENDESLEGVRGENGPLLELLREIRLGHQVDARALGLRLYAEKPDVFTDRLGAYWTAMHCDDGC